ncbi:hypothetical protein BDR26DRAFT_345712 [Obelidium mucronatum]|nr:hypothetical protein BDR26DRAFT_345712 [Obelidium mucronatum]
MSAMVVKNFGVQYEEKDKKYFEARTLTHSNLGPWQMFSVTFVCLASGLGCGWWGNTSANGWGSMITATAIMSIWQISVAVILSELMTMLPFIGGLATYTRAAFGPYVGYMIGQCELAEYTIFLAGNLNGLASSLNLLAGWNQKFIPIWWFIIMTFCFGVQVVKNKIFFMCFAFLCFCGITIVLAFTLPQISVVNSGKWAQRDFFDEMFNGNSTIAAVPYNQMDAMFPLGFAGIIHSIPYMMGDFQGLEIIPLMAEESANFIRDGPKAMFGTSFLFITLYWLLVLVVPSVPPGLFVEMEYWYPMINTFSGYIGLDEESSSFFAMENWVTAVYQASTTLSLFYAFSRLCFAVKEINLYLFNSLNFFSSRVLALFLSAGCTELKCRGTRCLGVLPVWLFDGSLFHSYSYFEPSVGGSLADITSALGPAGFLYLTLMYGSTAISFLYLRYKFPDFKRPIKSMFGIPCAVVVLAVCGFTFVSILLNPDHNVAVAIVAGKLVIGLIHMWFHR